MVMSRRNKRQNDSHAFTILLLLGAVYYANQELIDSVTSKLLVIVFALITLVAIAKLYQYFRSSLMGLRMSEIDHMSGVEFEHYMVGLLRKLGYKHVRMTEKYDLGIDIIADKDGITWGIQTKRHKSIVKAAAVRQAYTALSYYGCDQAMVISNSTYSNPARILANKTHTVLIDRHQLATWMKQR